MSIRKYPSYKNDVCGIYKITNIINSKFYIGSSVHIKHRWLEHLSQLRRNVHHNPYLQAAWNKYGETQFNFEMIESVSIEQLLLVEQSYLDKYSRLKNCYNIAICATATMSGISPSEETRRRMSKSMSGRIRTKEHCENLSKALMGNVILPATRKKISKTLTGKIESIETRQKKSLAWRGRTNNPLAHLTESNVIDIRHRYNQNKEDRKYKMKLATEYNVSWNTIHRIVIRQIWKHIGV